MTRAAQRLTGSDAGFLYIEGDSQTSTCVDVVVLGPSRDGSPLTTTTLRDHLAARLDRVPHLRRRLHLVPGGVGHAVWADDPTFALAAHVDHHELEREGETELHAYLAELTPTHLDLDAPLWRVTLVDGLDGPDEPAGRQALVFRFHHTLGDGAALLGILGELVDDRAERAPSPAPAHDLTPAPVPSRAWLLLTTLARQLLVWLTLPALLVRSVRRFRAVRERRESADVRVPSMAGGAPHCVLNVSRDSARAFSRTELPLAAVREVKETAGTTLTDVVVAVVAGALRSHLGRSGQLPTEPLVVNVPLGNDPAAAPPRLRGNVFVNYYALLATDVGDPVARLHATAAYDAEAKRQLEIQGRRTLTDWLDRIPPALAVRAARSFAARARSNSVAPDFNVLVSNLRVRHAAWTFGGRPVESVFMTGPVTDGGGLNVTVTGYGEQLTFAVHSNPSAVPDPAALADDLVAALAELRAAVRNLTSDETIEVA